MNHPNPITVKCHALASQAIDEACEVALEEGGIDHLLKLLAILTHGDVLPSPIVSRLQEQAARIAETRVA